KGARDIQTPIQLNCAACHQLDETPGNGNVRQAADAVQQYPAPSSGAYMAPINYEDHCRACHPLTLARSESDGNRATIVTVPHRLQPQDVRNYLWGAYAEAATAPLRPQPGSSR